MNMTTGTDESLIDNKLSKGRSFAKTDHRAAELAELVHESQRPRLTILFGSRARGDYAEGRSDIDILVVRDHPPDEGTLRNSWLEYENKKLDLFRGQQIDTDYIPSMADEFLREYRTVNALAARAANEGYMVGEQAQAFRTQARRRRTAHHLRWADAHLSYLERSADAGDEHQGAQACLAVQNALEAAVNAAGEWCPEIHDIGMSMELAGRADPAGSYETELDPEIYSQYFYSRRNLPPETPFTSNPGNRETAGRDTRGLLARVEEIRAAWPPMERPHLR